MKDNFEKVLLGLGCAAAVGLGAMGFLALKKVDEDYSAVEERNLDADPIESEDYIAKNIASLTTPPMLAMTKNEKGREVEVFTSVPLFVKKGEDALVDLLLSPPVHSEIPNDWWLKYKIDPGFADSPQRDHDNDGFSNLEEFEAGTNPADAKDFPSLFAKVKVSELKETKWLMKFTDYGAAGYSFNIQDTNGQKNRIRGGGAVAVGEKFFPEGPYQGRFLFKEASKKNDGVMDRAYATVEDQKQGKEGKVYEFPNNNRETFSDFTVTLFLDTPGQDNKPIDVEEGQSFSLPYDENAAEKPYTFKGVQDDGSILLLWDNNGEVSEKTLPAPN